MSWPVSEKNSAQQTQPKWNLILKLFLEWISSPKLTSKRYWVHRSIYWKGQIVLKIWRAISWKHRNGANCSSRSRNVERVSMKLNFYMFMFARNLCMSLISFCALPLSLLLEIQNEYRWKCLALRSRLIWLPLARPRLWFTFAAVWNWLSC